MEEDSIYDEKYFASFADPLLSKKLLRFSSYPAEKQVKQELMESKISKDIYGYKLQVVYFNGVGQMHILKPTYYQGARHSHLELHQFKESEQFHIFIRELEQCFAYINEWIKEQQLNIEYMERSGLGEEILRTIPAEEEFDLFLNRLTNGYYEDFETDMYGDGKKYLEKLAFFIHSNDIDLTFRKNQIISLLSDEGLRRCMGGCLTVLDMAVSNLENYGIYQPDRLISRFFSDILRTTSIKAPKLHSPNVVSQISKIINIELSISEVHIYNYLLQRAKRVFGLNFLNLVEDVHINLVTGPYSSDIRIKAKIDMLFQEEYIKPIKDKLRTADLVSFIADQIRGKLQTDSISPLEAINKLELWLSELGTDDYFSREDFFVTINNDYQFKLDFPLEITITERLFNSKWLELDLHESSRLFKRSNYFFKRNKGSLSTKPNLHLELQPYRLIYRIYYSNLELSWIKVHEKKLRILDFISTSNNLQHLVNIMGTYPEPFINSLLQTPYDMDLFFQFLAPDDLSLGLLWVNRELSTNFVTPSDKSVVWMYRFTRETERYRKILESVSSKVQKRLFLHLIENYHPFTRRLQTILDDQVRLPSRSQKELHTIMGVRYGIIYEIINNLIRLDIKNFSGLTFPGFHCEKCLISMSSPIYTYLMYINFENFNFGGVTFDTYIKNCKFNKANLHQTSFMKSVISSSFENTDLTSTRFMGANFMYLNLYGAIFSTESFLSLMQRTHTIKNQVPIADFTGADLRRVNFQNPEIQHELSKRIIDFSNALLQETDLSGLFRRENKYVFLEHTNLDGAQLRKCKLAGIRTMYTSMRGVVTDETVLSIDQLFQLYHQGHRDFSTDYIADTDPRTNFFDRESLAGAEISSQIFLTLVNNGFKNFDQAQLSSAPRAMRGQYDNYPKLLTSRSLQDRGQRVRLERLGLSQHKLHEVQKIISETLNHRQISKLQVLNQAELLHSYLFEAKNLEIHGRCIQLTSAFSEALIRNKQATYKNNLYVISELDKREIQRKPLSKKEEYDRKNFLEAMQKFEDHSEEGPIILPSWIHDKTIMIKDIGSLVEHIESPKQDFAWHIIIEPENKIGHILGVYRVEGKYAFFDSNVGYIDNINDKETFANFLKRIIKRSYLIHRNTKIYVNQYTPDIEFKKNPKINDASLENKLFTNFLTEQKRLSKLDEEGYLVISNHLVDRKTLYEIGFSYHEDGNLNLPGRLIDSEMNLDQKFLDDGLKNNKFSINSHYFQEFLLKYFQEERKSVVNLSLTRRRYSVDIETLHALLSLPTYQMFKNSIPIKTLEPLFDSVSSPLKRRMDLRTINKLLKKTVSRSQIFITQLEKNQLQKALIERLHGIGRKVPLPKALAGLIATKSFFDIGLSLTQNNYQAALLQSLMFSYGLFAEPWIEQSIIKLPKKFANFFNAHSSVLKISDKVLDTKRIVVPTRLFAGTAANVLDIVSLATSINKFMETEYGSKNWRDAIADITIDSTSLFSGAALVLANPSFGVGLGVGVFLIIGKGSYDGASLLVEYSAHDLTWAESIKTFLHGSIGLPAPQRVLYLHGRQEQMDTVVESYWRRLQTLQETFPTQNIMAYGGGLGEYKKDNEKTYREKTLNPVNDKIRKINSEIGERGKIPFLTENVGDTNSGISAILPYHTSSNFKENLSRLTPKKPDEKNIQFLCLPMFRNESIEIQSNIKLKKTIPEVIFSCTNAVVMLDTRQPNNLNENNSKKVILNMEYIYDGLIQKIPDFENVFFIFNGTTAFVANSNYGRPTPNTFSINLPYFSGNISLEGETNSQLILEDNSEIRTYNINLVPNNILMDVVSETFTGDIQGKFNTKNLNLVVGRRQKQDKYFCHYPTNDTIPFSIELQGLGGESRKPDTYMDCLNVMLHASSHYLLKADSNNTAYKWGFAHISVDANQAGVIVIKPFTKNSDELEVQPIHFHNLNLLKESRLSYCINKNQLWINKEFLSYSEDISLEKLDIQLESYWNYKKERSNYAFYDQFDNLITPLLTNDFIKSFKNMSPINIAECFHPQKFLLYRVVNLTGKHLLNPLKNLLSMVELEEAVENLLYNTTIIGPFEISPNLKALTFVDIQPQNYTLTMGNSDKNVFNLISNKNKLSSFYGDKDEDRYFLNLDDISGEKLIKINNYDPDSSVDRVELYTNHSLYELCIDQRGEKDNNFIFYIINRHEEKNISCSTEEQPVCCSPLNSTGPHVAKILLHNYLLADVYQHIEICISEKNEDIKCFIPFLDKDKDIKPFWFFKRYFRNPHDEEAIFKLDPNFSDIIVEGDVTKFEAVQREQDLILMKSKKEGGTGYNSLSLWFPNYHVNPGNWDLFHLYSTQNATRVDSRMRDLDNNFFREIYKIAIDYHSLENNLRFYELSFEDQNSNFIISHNQLQSNIISRNRRDMLSISKLSYEIGYLEISKNESFSLIDIKVAYNVTDLNLSIYMNQTLINTVNSYSVIVQNWEKPKYRLAGLLYRELSILNLETFDLKPKSLRWMQAHIHEKILEHNIHTILESDLETKLIWDKLRVFLLLPLPTKNYDTLDIMNFMQKILDFENIEELLDFFPDNSEDSTKLINNLYNQITENETLAKKIKAYLVYHVIKASFFGYNCTIKIIKDSFPMLADSLIVSIYSHVRKKLLTGHLWQTTEYVEALASTSDKQIILNQWLNILSSQSPGFQRQKRFDELKPLSLFPLEKYIFINDKVGNDKNQNLRIKDSDNFKRFKPIIREEAVTSSATQPKGWINSLFNYFLKEKSNSNPSVFDLDRPKDAVIKESIALDHCITGVTLGGIYREEGITCYSKNMKVMLFPKANSTKIAKPQDRYSKLPLRPIEFNGCPSVYFEGEQTHAFYVPEIPMNPLDSFNDQLILLRVLLHEVKKTYRWFKNFLTGKSDQSESLAEESGKSFITHQTKNSWKERLNNIEKQLSDVNRLARGKVDLSWIQPILEDRKEEFNALNQLTEQNLKITKAFTENLQALQTELTEIKENICFMQGNTDNFTDKKETILASRSKPYFFNSITQNLSLADCNVMRLNPEKSVQLLV